MRSDGSEIEVWTNEVAQFLRRPLHAVLATRAPDGTLSQSVVWYRLDPDSVWISCRPGAAKARHVEADPTVSLLVLAPHGGSYVRIEGRGLIDGSVSEADRLALVAPYQGAEAQQWIDSHPLPEPNALLRIIPARVVSRGV